MAGVIWLLSTRGRPKQAQAVLDACEETGMTQRGVVYVDGSRYPGLRAADNWEIVRAPKAGGLQASMQYVYGRFPDARAYGWLADDTYPRTGGWDQILSTVAGEWNLACARDLWLSEEAGTRAELEKGTNLSSGLCWGGDLVRHVGWWALPGVFQAGIDTAWCDLIAQFGLGQYVHKVIVEHKHWLAGTRPKDRIDMRDHIEADLARKVAWRDGPEYREALRRITVGLQLPDRAELRAEQEDELRERWNPSLPAARRETIAREVAERTKERSE